MRSSVFFLHFSKLTFVLLLLFLLYPAGYFVLDTQKDRQKTISTFGSTIPVSIIPNSVCAYIINLDRSQARYENLKNDVANLDLPFQRIAAVDGSVLSDAQLHELVDFESYQAFLNRVPKKGTIGCSLSHIKAWEAFLKSDFQYALILEDDIRFDAKLLKNTIEELMHYPRYWDINTFEIHHRGLPVCIKTFKNNQKLVHYLVPVTHTGAYMINRKAATRLLEKMLPIKMPVDHYFTRTWEFDLLFTGIENPRLVYQKQGRSEIETSRVALTKKSNTLGGMKRNYYAIKTGIIRIVYNLKCIITSWSF